MTDKRLYIDFSNIEELLHQMPRDEFNKFLNDRIIIPIDDKTYELLMLLKKNINLNVKKINNF